MKRAVAVVIVLCLVGGCIPPRPPPDHPVDHAPPLGAPEEAIEIVGADPDPSAYEFVGDIQGQARGSDMAETTRAARENLKANAAEYGATRVVIDTNNGAMGSFRMLVVLNGRAFRKKKPKR